MLDLTCDSANDPSRSHTSSMPELIAKANQAILEAQYLRKEGRSLRHEASVLATQLGLTVLQSRRVEQQSADLKTSLDRAFSKP